MSKILIVLNGKGGCGKTTLARELSACIAESGHKTLVIDFDAHAALTDALGIQYAPPGSSAVDVLLSADRPDVPGFILPVNFENLYILPGNKEMDNVAKRIDWDIKNAEGTADPDAPYKNLRKILDKVPFYEYVIIDCPDRPDNPLVMNALFAGGGILCPVFPTSTRSIEGVSEVFGKLDMVKRRADYCADLFGIVIMNADLRTNLSKQNINDLKHIPEIEHKIFHTKIRHSIRVDEVTRIRKPLAAVYPREEVTNDFRMLAKEVISRG